jgi:4-hydroxy-3-polyprenylbenzoate decarboxylase
MPIDDIQKYIQILEKRKELTRITVPVDPLLEIAAITDRICKRSNAPALLFEKPAGSSFSVATNLFGSLHRSALALGLEDLGQLSGKMAGLLSRIQTPDINHLDQQISSLPEFSRFLPQASSPCWNMLMHEPDLTVFPFLQNYPGDGAASGCPRYITLPQIFTTDPDGKNSNCGMYRAQVMGPRELAVRWMPGSGAARHLDQFRCKGAAMPVAIAMGGAPVALFSAMLPLPGGLDELTFAGFLQGSPLGVAVCRTVPLSVPASAEVVIEGFVDPAETIIEGPFGNHTGCYSPAAPAALMRVTSISHRPESVIPATVVGPPPMEDCWMGKAWERILLGFLRKLIPEVVDIHFPLEWIFHQSAIISLEHPKPGMVSEIASRLWDMTWFSGARLLIFVDGAYPVDPSGIAWRCINLADFACDMIQDASRKRLALDATGSRLPLDQTARDTDVMQRVLQHWQDYGLP